MFSIVISLENYFLLMTCLYYPEFAPFLEVFEKHQILSLNYQNRGFFARDQYDKSLA